MEAPPPDDRLRDFEKWLVRSLIAAIALIAIVLIFGEGMIHHGKSDHQNGTALPVHPTEPAMPVPPEPAALGVLQNFFEAPDTAAKSQWVHNPARVRPEMEDFHDRRGHPYPTLGRVSTGHPAEFGGTPWVLFEVEPFSGPRYPVAVVWDGGRFAVDWESMTAYGTMDWIEFLETRPQTIQTLRVFLRATPLTLPALPADHTCFLLEHRDDTQSVIAIASGETASHLTALTGPARAPATLEMRFQPIGPGGSLVAVITRLAHPRWIR